MFTRKTLVFTLVVAALAGIAPAVTLADAAGARNGAPCVLHQYRVTSVVPYRTEEHVGKATLQRLRGAEIRVQAQAGLSAEWLRLQLAQQVARMKGAGMKDCALDLQGERVQVDPAGTGYSVKLVVSDSESAKEVLRRARLLLD